MPRLAPMGATLAATLRRAQGRLFAALGAGLVVALPLGAQPAVADFVEYLSPVTTEYQAGLGTPITDAGFDFYNGGLFLGFSRNALGTWGADPALDPVGARNRPVNIGASNTLFGTDPVEEINVYVAGEEPLDPQRLFNLRSIDVAHLYSSSYFGSLNVPLAPISLTIFGVRGRFPATGSIPVITQTFMIPAPPAVNGVQDPVLQTLVFDRRWRGLSTVVWTQASVANESHQFTNFRASVVPEPGTYLLVLTGLGGLALVAARRRRATGASRIG